MSTEMAAKMLWARNAKFRTADKGKKRLDQYAYQVSAAGLTSLRAAHDRSSSAFWAVYPHGENPEYFTYGVHTRVNKELTGLDFNLEFIG
jgi:hypothetical protein